ncbi:MAG: ATP-binding cassette domain-containing protein [Bacteroidales bacterium]|nr:ATP-binding cassette domain-containing protein [Bacteroidales bacterium]
MEEALVKYLDVEIQQEGIPILEHVNLEFHKGEFIFLIGKVGTGKTSLMKTMYGELDITSGEARVLDNDMTTIKRKNIPQLRRRVGIIFQDFQLLIDRTVYENLAFVLKATGWDDKVKIGERIDEVLNKVGMQDKAQKMPSELSGGEQQRIVIARAVLNNPDIILADEPTGNLDTETGVDIVNLLQEFSEKGALVIMSTHNLHIVRKFNGKVLELEDKGLTDVTGEYGEETIKENN